MMTETETENLSLFLTRYDGSFSFRGDEIEVNVGVSSSALLLLCLCLFLFFTFIAVLFICFLPQQKVTVLNVHFTKCEKKERSTLSRLLCIAKRHKDSVPDKIIPSNPVILNVTAVISSPYRQ